MTTLTSSPSEATENLERTNVLGVGISAINYDSAIAAIDRWISSGHRSYVTVTGVHGVMESQKCESLRQIHNSAGLVTPDGMPMVWLSRLGGHKQVSRVYGPNLMLRVCEHSTVAGYRHFLYGGAEGVADELAEALVSRFPGIQIAGTYCPPFRSLSDSEEQEIADRINHSKADIVWVGLSTPKQERWMARFRERLSPAALIGVGAAFDFNTGRVKQAPSWMQRSGLEWFFRLIQEPRRLWRRYLTNNPLFLAYLALTALGLRKRKSLEHGPQLSNSQASE